MTDTYNDTTGSRKKFLIPLVVLLLCAVSLTGAGYAYNSSVTVNDGTAGADEYFVLDLYDDQAAVITSNVQVTTEAVDGLVITTAKTTGVDSAIVGTLAMEDIEVMLYQGMFKISTANLDAKTEFATVDVTSVAAEFSATTLYAIHDETHSDPAKWVGVPAVLVKWDNQANKWVAAEPGDQGAVNAHQFAVANGTITTTEGEPAKPVVKFFEDAQNAPGDEVTDGTFDIDTFYWYSLYIVNAGAQITEADVEIVADDPATPEDETVLLDKIQVAEDFAKAVVASLKINFDFTIQATAVENTYEITLAMGDGATDGSAVASVTDGKLYRYVAATFVDDSKVLAGYKNNAGDVVINADGTLATGVAGYTDAQGNWIHEGAVTLTAQWTTP